MGMEQTKLADKQINYSMKKKLMSCAFRGNYSKMVDAIHSEDNPRDEMAHTKAKNTKIHTIN